MLSTIKDTILRYDRIAWYYMNTQWHNSFLDTVLPYLRNQYFWVPLYFFLLLFIPSRFKLKGWLWCLGFLIAFGLSDQINVAILKPYFHRVRPCNNPALSGIIHLIVERSTGLSFPSSHAANHFSMGIYSAVTLGKCARWVWPVAIAWAAIVSLAQVYVGVHYPLDVLCGGLVGTTIGICTGKIFNHFFDLSTPPLAFGKSA